MGVFKDMLKVIFGISLDGEDGDESQKAWMEEEISIPDPRSMRVETVKAVARKATMRITARSNPDHEEFERLRWVQLDAAREITKAISEKANDGLTSCKISIEGDTKFKEHKMPLYIGFSTVSTIWISSYIASSKDIGEKHRFEDDLAMWTFYYELVDWVEAFLRKSGYELSWEIYEEDHEGWNDAKTRRTYIVSWADKDLDDNLESVYDESQAEGYERGLKLEDLFLADPDEYETQEIQSGASAVSDDGVAQH